jgi:peptidoglycan hydrolase-like protein with peptidoglycan-binding domain
MTNKEQKANKSAHKPDHVRPSTAKPSGEIQPEDLEQIIQRARSIPTSLSNQDIAVLQRTIGNQAVGHLLPVKRESAHHKITTLSQPGAGASLSIQLREDLGSPRFAGDATLEKIFDGNGTLKEGDESDAVRKVQHAIQDAGILFMGHGTDGKFGTETTKRVRKFQFRKGVKGDPSGEVGVMTLDKLDQLFPKMALPSAAGDAYTFSGMKEILCQWNSAMIQDLKNLKVTMVGDLEWADKKFNGTDWEDDPMAGGGETTGHSILVATDTTNEGAAQSLYHEYQHAREPWAYRTKSWAEEESRVYSMETIWAIARGMATDPSLTKTDPKTGKVEVDPAGVKSQVESYPGLSSATPGEVIKKLKGGKVKVRLDDGKVITRPAVNGDKVPGKTVTKPPKHRVKDKEWCC